MLKAFSLLGIWLLVGAAAGLLGALCGVGGGIVLVPVFKLMGIDHKIAVATSLAVIVPTAMMATFKNQLHGLIDWKLMAAVAAGAVIAAYFGADLMKSMSNPVLTKIFAILLIVTGAQMLFTKG